MIFQNFGFNQNYPVAAGGGPTGFPDQSLATWTSTESAQWLSYGASVCNTTTFAYSGSTVRVGAAFTGTSAKWAGGSLASNGKIYAGPHSRTDWLVIDTNNDTRITTGTVNGSTVGSVYDKITDTVYSFGSGGAKIVCSTNSASNISGPADRTTNPVQGFNGDYLYGVGEFFSQGIRIYQISTNTTTTSSAAPGNYFGERGTLGSDGCIYYPNEPAATANILKYDPVADTCTNIATGGGVFATMIQHYDGFIYLLPNDASTVIKKLNVSTGVISAAHTMASTFQSSNACIGLDGRIYIVSSLNATSTIRWFDPTANTSGNITLSNGDYSYQGITMGANGDLYLIPWNNSLYVHKLPLVTGTGTTATNIVSQYNFGGRMVWPG
jgi:hypothetical protein